VPPGSKSGFVPGGVPGLSRQNGRVPR
jgi:hypothetical protein